MDLNLTSARNILPDFYFESLSAALDGLRRSHILTDIVLITQNGESFAMHRVVLVMGCPYCRKLLTERNAGNQGSLSLPPSINSECMNAVVDYLYSGQITLPDNLEITRQLLQASKTLEMDNFFTYLSSLLSNSMSTENFSTIWDFADEFDDENLRNVVVKYLSSDLQYFSSQKEFLTLDVKRIKQILCSPQLDVNGAKSVINAVLKWAAANISTRAVEMENELLPHIKFALIPKSDLEHFLSLDLCTQISKKLWNCIAKTLYSRGIHISGYQPDNESITKNEVLVNTQEKDKKNQKNLISTHEDHAISPISDKSNSSRVLVVDVQELKVHDAVRFPLTQLANVNVFKQLPNKLPKRTPRRKVWSSPLRIVVEGNEDSSITRQDTSIMIIGWKKNGEAATHCFNLQTNIWTSALNLEEVLASNAAWALHGSMLYLAGGMDNNENVLKSTVIYNVEQNSFQIASRMNIARSSSNAAVVCWNVYVVGGLGQNRKPLNHVERYDILLDRWDVVECLPYSGWDIGVTDCDGKLYTFGGCCYGDNDYCENGWSMACHSYDPEVNQWTNIGTLPDDLNNSFPVITNYNRKIYVLSYYAPTSVWSLDVVSKKWHRLHMAVGCNPSVLRRTLAVLPHENKLWVIDFCGKLLVFNLNTNNWDREYPFSRTITFPLYCSIVNLSIQE